MDGWNELSNWYDQKQGESGDLWHRTLIDPVLMKVVGDCRGKEVLDLGCGNGYLSRRLARKGAKVTAVDFSPEMVRNAMARDTESRVRYIRADAKRLKGVPDSKFDVVIANMSLMDMKDAEGAVAEAARILKKRGRFVASISHPCFDVMSNSCWVAEKELAKLLVVYRRVRGYRKTFSERTPWNIRQGKKKAYTVGYHRPLNWYARVFSSKGLAITALEEPEPNKEFIEKEGYIDGAGFLEVPLHLVIEAVKL